MGKNLAIYGSGGLGHEILELARQVNSKDKRWDNFVFVNTSPQSFCGFFVFPVSQLTEGAGTPAGEKSGATPERRRAARAGTNIFHQNA